MAPDRPSFIGCAVKSLKPDLDNDANGEDRQIPPGTAGVIMRINHVDSKGTRHYDVAWENGAWTVYSDSQVLTDLKLIECPRHLNELRLNDLGAVD